MTASRPTVNRPEEALVNDAPDHYGPDDLMPALRASVDAAKQRQGSSPDRPDTQGEADTSKSAESDGVHEGGQRSPQLQPSKDALLQGAPAPSLSPARQAAHDVFARMQWNERGRSVQRAAGSAMSGLLGELDACEARLAAVEALYQGFHDAGSVIVPLDGLKAALRGQS